MTATADMLVIIPSRGRPDNVRAVCEAVQATATGRTDIMFGFDDDDPTCYELRREVVYEVGPRLRLVGTLNAIATKYADEYDFIGFAGDDHRPRTKGWDTRLMQALGNMGTGIAYGNDLFQCENLPTAVFLTSDIVRALGYMAPPVVKHMYADNAWKAWGHGAGRLAYLPDVILEHMHPQAGGKAPMDDRYADVWGLFAEDEVAYRAYEADGLAQDIAKIRGLL